MSAPNIQTSINANTVTGGTAGTKVGYTATETVGFFGSTGTAQPTSASITDYASLKVALQALGLIGA